MRELPGKIKPMLDRGTPKLWLKARLFGWKLQYRLRKLALTRNRIIIGNSPDRLLVDGHELSQSDVRLILNFVTRIGRRVAASEFGAEGSALSNSIQSQLAASDSAKLERSRLPALRSYFLGRGQQTRGSRREFELAGGFKVGERTPPFARRASTGTVFIEKAGFYNPDVVKLLREDPKRASAALRAFARGKNPILTGKLSGRGDELAATAFLMFGLEPSRNVGSLVTSALVTDFVHGGMDPEEAIGLFPMGAQKAMATGRRVEAFRNKKVDLNRLAKGKRPRQMIESTVRLVAKSLQIELGLDLFKDSGSVTEKLNKLESVIEKKVREFYRQRGR
jgi:hypothetical protein